MVLLLQTWDDAGNETLTEFRDQKTSPLPRRLMMRRSCLRIKHDSTETVVGSSCPLVRSDKSASLQPMGVLVEGQGQRREMQRH